MQPDGKPFRHWTYRLLGDPSLNPASITLVSRLLARDQLRQPRAWLARPARLDCLRQTLLIAFAAPLRLTPRSAPCGGLWLVETRAGQVFAYAAPHPATTASIGGLGLPDLAVLDPAAPWVAHLADQLASQTLATPAARRAGPDRPSDHWLLARVEATLLGAALSEFLAHLDPEVLAVVRTAGDATPGLYNTYCGLAPAVRRNRLQAVQAFPWFADALHSDWRLRRAVAQGAPLTGTLADQFQVKPRTIAQTRALSWRPAHPAARAALLTQIDALPAEYVPRDAADWDCYRALATPLADLATLLQVPLPKLLKPLRAGWQVGLATLARQAGGPLDLEAIVEMMQAAYQYGLRPALLASPLAQPGLPDWGCPRQAPAAFFPLWFGHYGLARLSALAYAWRAALVRFSLDRLGSEDAAADQPPALLQWPPLFHVSHRRGAYRIHELTSQLALEQEGQRLEHCIGTYAAVVLVEDSFLFSVRDPLGRSLSSFEVKLPAAGPVLVQHQALANSVPDRTLQALVADYLQLVLAKVPARRLATVRAERQGIAAGAGSLLGRLALLEEEGSVTGAVDSGAAVGLAALTAPLHPAAARQAGLAAYVRQCGGPVLAALHPAG